MFKSLVYVAAVAFAAGLPTVSNAAPAARNYAGIIPQGSNMLMVFANPVAGKEAEFADWYETHMNAMAKLPGMVRIQRLQAVSRQGRPDAAFGYSVLYEYTGDANEMHQRIQAAVKDGKVASPDPRYVAKYDSMVYRAVTPGVVSK